MERKLAEMSDGVQITYVLLTELEFNELVTDMENWFDLMGYDIEDLQFDTVREMRAMPLLTRTTETERYFDRFEAPTKLMVVLENRVFDQMMEMMEDYAKKLKEQKEKKEPTLPPSRPRFRSPPSDGPNPLLN